MSELNKARKEDVYQVAYEMGLDVQPSMTLVRLRELIKSSPRFEEEFVNSLVKNQIAAREEKQRQEALEEQRRREALEEKRRQEALEEKRRQDELEKMKLEMNFELEKLKLQTQSQVNSVGAVGESSAESSFPESKVDVKRLLPSFDADVDDITLFLVLLERQLKLLKVPERLWVSHLLSVVPSSISILIARESEENASNFSCVKDLLLKRFKISAEKCRQLFFSHRKLKESTWKDYYFELRAYFENWLKELKVETFEDLKDLFIANQMKRRVSLDCKENMLDDWESLNTPELLADKLDAYESIRSTFGKKEYVVTSNKKGTFTHDNYRKINKPNVPSKRGEAPITPEDSTRNRENKIACYGCGKPGFIKRKCPNCSGDKNKNIEARQLLLYSCNSSVSSALNIPITVCNKEVYVCADTGATRSIAGERMFKLFQESGTRFRTEKHEVTLADGVTRARETLSAVVPILIKGIVVETEFLILPNARGNRTLLGLDFLQKSKVVLDTAQNSWYFGDKPQERYQFLNEYDLLNTVPIAKVEINPYALRNDEGKDLTSEQRDELNSLLKKYEKCFRPGGEATPYAEHRINTGNNAPVSVPPYRMTPARKEILKKEIDNLIAQGIIEECESPYASPIVFVPKPDGSMRLCVDYRKLNAITTPDTYPLPRMDDLLHEARQTSYMSTLDLRSGYHQIKVYPPDQDKTAFVCPFGTFRYLRMPFGLRNAPSEFQRMINKFLNGLKNALSYLDDIIVLSDTFENHISDLEAVFERLLKYKLDVKREKCHFACEKVKYLGHWITPKGLEVDPSKVEAIVSIPPPKTVKQLQSFLQTCSWYRRFIPKFADISRPLSNLTKKKAAWIWGELEQRAFETLKECLVTPPVLKQADGTKPFILRTDASDYALGAVLLQGEDQSSEHPIEFASRLLNKAERNYTTTEREALAVVWALGKFRGYIEGQEITIATDHQPLKWLMTLKSPSGRLARWALLIQSFRLNIEYVPGKSNVVADMLSRPTSDVDLDFSEMCNFVGVDMPTRNPSSIREAQLSDENLKKIIDCFESNSKDENFANWTDRGYLMNQGVLYRYAPDSESEEAQLVVPAQERENIFKLHHDVPTAGHYGEEGTFQRIVKRYYWTGMRAYISENVKKCPECSRYKANNQKPAGLLRTPVYAQRFETVSIDLFGPLPQSKEGHKWIFIVEDCATRWVELFPLFSATARECATTLIEEVFFRYGIPRRLISDNGSQFVCAVLQQVCCTLDIDQILTPVYHPQANPVERKNRDLKPRLAILVGDDHDAWPEKLPSIRFALNTAKSDTTGQTAAYLQYGRELRTIDDVVHDFKAVLDNDNFVPEITPYLKRLSKITEKVKERIEMKQDKRKEYFDKKRRKQYFEPGVKVWVTTHPVSKANKKKTSKFMPKRDGPYMILTQKSPVTYIVSNLNKPNEPIGTYHVSTLKPFKEVETVPVAPLRKRGRPPKTITVPSSGRSREQRGRM